VEEKRRSLTRERAETELKTLNVLHAMSEDLPHTREEEEERKEDRRFFSQSFSICTRSDLSRSIACALLRHPSSEFPLTHLTHVTLPTPHTPWDLRQEDGEEEEEEPSVS